MSLKPNANIKDIGAGDTTNLRDGRNFSTTSLEENPDGKDSDNGKGDDFNAKEVEEVVFECINCSG